MTLLTYLREFNMASVLLRLTLAVLLGGIIGINREHKRQPAGFRTYMMVCMGAALTMVLGQYQYMMLDIVWKEAQREVGMCPGLAPRSSMASAFWAPALSW